MRRRGTALVAASTALLGLGTAVLTVAPTPVVGEVRAADGSPLHGVAVRAGGHATLTDAEGRYHLLWVPRRSRHVEAGLEGFVPVVMRLRTGAGFFGQRVNVRLERSPRVIGWVLSEAGRPLPAAHVMLFMPSRWTPEQVPAEAFTDQDGRFAFDGLPLDEVTIEVLSPGYVMGEVVVALRPGALHRIVERLERERGRLRIKTDPPGATVTVAGSSATCVSPCELVLESGDYHVTLNAPRYVPLELGAQIVHQRETSLGPRLERMMGHLRVSAPAGAQVLLNDALVGEAPWEGDLPTDVYRVRVRPLHGWPAQAPAEVKWRQNTLVEFNPSGFGRHPDRAAWVDGLESYLSGLDGRYGVAVMDLDQGVAFGTRMDDLFTAASVIKLPIALFAYHEVEGQRLKFEDQWEMLAGDVTGGTGVLQAAAPGTKYTIRELLDVLVRQSDNTAATMFRRILGEDKIDAYMAELGAPNTRQVSVTTPRETLGLLALLWRGQVLTAEHRDDLLTLLKTTAFHDWLPAGVPAGVPVAHKIGMFGLALNDVGIVYAGRPYVLCVFTETTDWDGAARVLALISGALYEFEQ